MTIGEVLSRKAWRNWIGKKMSSASSKLKIRVFAEGITRILKVDKALGDIQAFIITADWKRHLNKDALMALLG